MNSLRSTPLPAASSALPNSSVVAGIRVLPLFLAFATSCAPAPEDTFGDFQGPGSHDQMDSAGSTGEIEEGDTGEGMTGSASAGSATTEGSAGTLGETGSDSSGEESTGAGVCVSVQVSDMNQGAIDCLDSIESANVINETLGDVEHFFNVESQVGAACSDHSMVVDLPDAGDEIDTNISASCVTGANIIDFDCSTGDSHGMGTNEVFCHDNGYDRIVLSGVVCPGIDFDSRAAHFTIRNHNTGDECIDYQMTVAGAE